MGMPGQTAHALKAKKEQSDARAAIVWERYHEPGGPPMHEIADEVGITERHCWRLLSAKQEEYAKTREEDAGKAKIDALSESARMRAHAMLMYFEADNAADAKRWADIVAGRIDWETKIGGWAAPVKSQVEDTTLSAADLAEVRKAATPEEVADLRRLIGDPSALNDLARSILRRARLAPSEDS